jgi:hypothetical protein
MTLTSTSMGARSAESPTLHAQRLGDVTERIMRAWLEHHRATWRYMPTGVS